MSPSASHPHIGDVPELRAYLLERYRSDSEASDDQLAQIIERSKVRGFQTGRDWRDEAATAVRLLTEGPYR